MPRLAFFDCNCTVGRRTAPRPENNLSLDELLAELAYAGIANALAVHAYAVEYDLRTGNDRISEVSAAHPVFTPCYVLLPHYTGEIPGCDALLRYLSDGGAGAVRLFPRDHNYGLGETWCGSLFSTLEEAGVPVLLDVEQSDWNEIDGVLAAHGRLNLVLLRVGYRISRWLYPMMARYTRLHIEPAFYAVHRGIETVVRRFGSDHLVFGTGLPVWDAGAAIAAVCYAEVDDESRLRMAGGTLRGVLWDGL